MNKMLFITAVFSLCLYENAIAKKRKSMQREWISYQSGFFSFVHNNHKTTGNIYELSIQVNTNGVIIDSVWFGATPVPCDVYEIKTMQRIAPPISKGKYLIKANKNLYENFYRSIDSSFAYNHFIAPFPFAGELVIMYVYKGKRYFKSVKQIEQRAQKPLRD